MSFKSPLTWPSALSAVAITWLARSVLPMARLILVMSLRRFSLAIKPAGSFLPVLIFNPVLSRVNACCNAPLDRPNVFWATSELTFVLIRVISNPPFEQELVQPWAAVHLRPAYRLLVFLV